MRQTGQWGEARERILYYHAASWLASGVDTGLTPSARCWHVGLLMPSLRDCCCNIGATAFGEGPTDRLLLIKNMNKNIEFKPDSLKAVKHHTERTEAHNEQFTLMPNEGKPNHREFGRTDFEGKILVKCPVTGVESLFWMQLQEDAYRSGKRYMYISLSPWDVEKEVKEYTPSAPTTKATPKKRKPYSVKKKK